MKPADPAAAAEPTAAPAAETKPPAAADTAAAVVAEAETKAAQAAEPTAASALQPKSARALAQEMQEQMAGVKRAAPTGDATPAPKRRKYKNLGKRKPAEAPQATEALTPEPKAAPASEGCASAVKAAETKEPPAPAPAAQTQAPPAAETKEPPAPAPAAQTQAAPAAETKASEPQLVPLMPDGTTTKQAVYKGATISLRNGPKQQSWRVFFPKQNFPDVPESKREVLRQFGTAQHPGTPEKQQAAWLAAVAFLDESALTA